MDDVEVLRTGLAAVGAGDRAPDLRVGGDDELAQVARAVEAMVAQLAAAEERREEAEAARRSLIAAVSHDLRTPVTALRLLAEAVDDEIGDPETRREYVRRLGVHVRALGALIDDLFELTRIEAGEVAWTMRQVQIDELVEETVAAMAPAARAGGISVRAEIEPALVPAHVNPERIQRVLFNLIQNAIRHTPADGSVTVRAARAGTSVEIEVADTGAGIARRRPRARLRAVRPGCRPRVAHGRQRRARPCDLARDRRGARRPDLDRRGARRGRRSGCPRALQPARRGARTTGRVTPVARS